MDKLAEIKMVKNNFNNFRKAKEQVEDFLNSDSGYAKASKVIIAILAVGGVVFVGAVAPNMFQIFRSFKGFKESKKFNKKTVGNSIYSLQRNGFIKIVKEKNGKKAVVLTNKGKKRAREFSLETLTITKPKQWDGQWRVIIFDVPIKFNNGRRAMRCKIQELGFIHLQKSVWICPYPCEDEILFIAKTYNIDSFVDILTVSSFLKEDKLKKMFNLV